MMRTHNLMMATYAAKGSGGSSGGGGVVGGGVGGGDIGGKAAWSTLAMATQTHGSTLPLQANAHITHRLDDMGAEAEANTSTQLPPHPHSVCITIFNRSNDGPR